MFPWGPVHDAAPATSASATLPSTVTTVKHRGIRQRVKLLRAHSEGSDEAVAESIELQKANAQAKAKAIAMSSSQLSISQLSALDKKAKELMYGRLPAHLEGERFTYTDTEGDPSGEGSPAVDYPEDTDIVEKSFVNEKLVAPKYIPFKGIEDVYKRYKK